jgi:hypothetical protein
VPFFFEPANIRCGSVLNLQRNACYLDDVAKVILTLFMQ